MNEPTPNYDKTVASLRGIAAGTGTLSPVSHRVEAIDMLASMCKYPNDYKRALDGVEIAPESKSVTRRQEIQVGKDDDKVQPDREPSTEELSPYDIVKNFKDILIRRDKELDTKPVKDYTVGTKIDKKGVAKKKVAKKKTSKRYPTSRGKFLPNVEVAQQVDLFDPGAPSVAEQVKKVVKAGSLHNKMTQQELVEAVDHIVEEWETYRMRDRLGRAGDLSKLIYRAQAVAGEFDEAHSK